MASVIRSTARARSVTLASKAQNVKSICTCSANTACCWTERSAGASTAGQEPSVTSRNVSWPASTEPARSLKARVCAHVNNIGPVNSVMSMSVNPNASMDVAIRTTNANAASISQESTAIYNLMTQIFDQRMIESLKKFKEVYRLKIEDRR